MAQFVLKIEKMSHIMGPRASQDLRSPSPIMAPAGTLKRSVTIGAIFSLHNITSKIKSTAFGFVIFHNTTSKCGKCRVFRDRSFIKGGGLVQMGWVSYLFVHPKMGGCIKFCNYFWEVMYFCAFQFPSYRKETTLKESTSPILFIIKMMV